MPDLKKIRQGNETLASNMQYQSNKQNPHKVKHNTTYMSIATLTD